MVTRKSVMTRRGRSAPGVHDGPLHQLAASEHSGLWVVTRLPGINVVEVADTGQEFRPFDSGA